MTHSPQDAYREANRKFMRVFLPLAALAALSACALIAHYAEPYGSALFLGLSIAMFGLQLCLALCLVDLLGSERSMRTGTHWILARVLVYVLVALVASLGAVTYNNALIGMIIACGALDTSLVWTSL